VALTSVSVAGIGALILREFPEVIEAASEAFQAPEPTDVEALLDGVDAITLFLRSRIDGTQLEVSTGASYPSARAVSDRKPDKMWCYVAVGQGVRIHVELGTRTRNRAPEFTNLAALSDADQKVIGLSRAELRRAAREHCQFDDFDPTKSAAN